MSHREPAPAGGHFDGRYLLTRIALSPLHQFPEGCDLRDLQLVNGIGLGRASYSKARQNNSEQPTIMP